MAPTMNRRLCIYLAIPISLLVTSACADKKEPVKLKNTNAAAAITPKPIDGTKAQPGSDKTFAGVVDAFKVGEADTAKYEPARSATIDSALTTASSSESYKSTNRLMPIVRYTGHKPKIPGGERPGDRVGLRAGDQKS